jgi:hypothetical protein
MGWLRDAARGFLFRVGVTRFRGTASRGAARETLGLPKLIESSRCRAKNLLFKLGGAPAGLLHHRGIQQQGAAIAKGSFPGVGVARHLPWPLAPLAVHCEIPAKRFRFTGGFRWRPLESAAERQEEFRVEGFDKIGVIGTKGALGSWRERSWQQPGDFSRHHQQRFATDRGFKFGQTRSIAEQALAVMPVSVRVHESRD